MPKRRETKDVTFTPWRWCLDHGRGKDNKGKSKVLVIDVGSSRVHGTQCTMSSHGRLWEEQRSTKRPLQSVEDRFVLRWKLAKIWYGRSWEDEREPSSTPRVRHGILNCLPQFNLIIHGECAQEGISYNMWHQFKKINSRNAKKQKSRVHDKEEMTNWNWARARTSIQKRINITTTS